MIVWVQVVMFAMARISDNVLVPKIMGQSVGVSPIGAMFAVFAGASSSAFRVNPRDSGRGADQDTLALLYGALDICPARKELTRKQRRPATARSSFLGINH